jgi:hypothetical protein
VHHDAIDLEFVGQLQNVPNGMWREPKAIIMAHPATDVLSWNQYFTDQGVWIIAVIAVVAMMYIMAT